MLGMGAGATRKIGLKNQKHKISELQKEIETTSFILTLIKKKNMKHSIYIVLPQNTTLWHKTTTYLALPTI